MDRQPLQSAGPINVALFAPSMTGGGAEKVFRRLAGGLADLGMRIDLVLASAEGPNLRGLSPAVRVVDLRCRRLAASVVPLARYLDQEGPDILLSTLVHANLVAIWARSLARNAPQLIVREANTLSVASSNSKNVRGRVAVRLARAFYPQADAVVAVSKGVAEDLVHNVGVPQSMVRVIYNPSFESDIASLLDEPVAHPWFRDGGPPVVIAVGSLSLQKRFDILLRAVSIARRQRPVRVIVLGDGEERQRLEALAQTLDMERSVSLPGFVDNPYAYLARSDLYALSSAWEGFPNTLVEAMASGLPVVSTDCPSGPREILDSCSLGTGRFGTLVPVADPEALAKGILRELVLKRDRVGLARRAQRFSLERAVTSYANLMHKSGPGRRG